MVPVLSHISITVQIETFLVPGLHTIFILLKHPHEVSLPFCYEERYLDGSWDTTVSNVLSYFPNLLRFHNSNELEAKLELQSRNAHNRQETLLFLNRKRAPLCPTTFASPQVGVYPIKPSA